VNRNQEQNLRRSLGFEFRIQRIGFRVHGLGFRV